MKHEPVSTLQEEGLSEGTLLHCLVPLVVFKKGRGSPLRAWRGWNRVSSVACVAD